MLTQGNVLANLCSCVYTRTLTPGMAHACPLLCRLTQAPLRKHATIWKLSRCFHLGFKHIDNVANPIFQKNEKVFQNVLSLWFYMLIPYVLPFGQKIGVNLYPIWSHIVTINHKLFQPYWQPVATAYARACMRMREPIHHHKIINQKYR